MRRVSRLLFYGAIFFVFISLASIFYGDQSPAAPEFQSHGALTNRLKFKASTNAPQLARNSTLGFERVFVLTTPDRPDHLDQFASSAAATGVEAESLQGVRGGEVSSDTLPTLQGLPRAEHERNEVVGVWRSHLNFVREVVNRRLSTALILEDEVDWDLNLKVQLELFSQASRYITRVPEDNAWSPFGDDWDLIWLGHCGAQIQPGDLRRFLIENDATVAAPQRRFNKFPETVDMVKEGYEEHSRIVFRTVAARCPNAYALSYRGARRVLHALSTTDTFAPFDVALSNLCAGDPKFKCLSLFPQLFEKYPKSDTTEDGPNKPPVDKSNIVFSTRLNMARLLSDETVFARQFPDDPEATGATQTRTLGRD